MFISFPLLFYFFLTSNIFAYLIVNVQEFYNLNEITIKKEDVSDIWIQWEMWEAHINKINLELYKIREKSKQLPQLGSIAVYWAGDLGLFLHALLDKPMHTLEILCIHSGRNFLILKEWIHNLIELQLNYIIKKCALNVFKISLLEYAKLNYTPDLKSQFMEYMWEFTGGGFFIIEHSIIHVVLIWILRYNLKIQINSRRGSHVI